ncbi:hypothetical protein [Acidovorax sp.]|uniref:hypothetical protein n=1 Tax=Acidovorax sp. TaxID=1872122 RepID=UPI0031D4BDAB
MPPSLATLNLKSWNRFRTPNLSVCTELLGRSHTFIYEGRRITVKLPRAPAGKKDESSDRLSLVSWRPNGEDIIPLQYNIYSVDVSIDIDEEFRLPPEILTRNPNALDLLTTEQSTSLDRCTDESHFLSLRAFDFWTRMMRWQTEQHLIGRDDPNSPLTGMATYLVDKQSGKEVWIGTHRMTLHMSPEISEDVWCATQSLLSEVDRIPVSVDLYFDALYHLHIGDLKRAISDAAVAAESHVRAVVQEAMPDGAGPELRRLVDEANIRPIIERVYGEALSLADSPGKFEIPSGIHKLFDYRNKVLHKGAVEGLTEDRCRKLIASVRELLWRKGAPVT